MTPAQTLLQVTVARKRPVAQGIVAFELVAADGGALPAFAAGDHIDVHLPDGPTRSYSLCNAPGPVTHYEIAVLRDPASRGGSRALHEAVQVGQALRISAPKSLFPLHAGAAPALLLAGGIGITPLLSMAEALAAEGRPFTLHYCARRRDQAAFLDRLAAAPWASQVDLHFSQEADGRRPDLAALLAMAAPGSHLYVCGPQGFMDAALDTARAQGWPAERLHCERFGGDIGPRDSDEAFDVELAHSGRVIPVAKGQTIVQALDAAGVSVMVSCEQGVCGTCLTGVKAGLPDHRDAYLTPEEQAANDQMLLCCSRARTARLVLAL